MPYRQRILKTFAIQENQPNSLNIDIAIMGRPGSKFSSYKENGPRVDLKDALLDNNRTALFSLIDPSKKKQKKENQTISEFANIIQNIQSEDKDNDYIYMTHPFKDFSSPSVESFHLFREKIFNLSDNDYKILLHCGAGNGRSGTMEASLYLYNQIVTASPQEIDKGFIRIPYTEKLSTFDKRTPAELSNCTTYKVVETAISSVRVDAPKAVENSNQLFALEKYAENLKDNIPVFTPISLDQFDDSLIIAPKKSTVTYKPFVPKNNTGLFSTSGNNITSINNQENSSSTITNVSTLKKSL